MNNRVLSIYLQKVDDLDCGLGRSILKVSLGDSKLKVSLGRKVLEIGVHPNLALLLIQRFLSLFFYSNLSTRSR